LFNFKIEAKSGSKITLKEFISQANSVAVALIKRGITKSEKFCIFSPNTIAYYVSLYVSYFLGLTVVPFSPAYAIYELKKDIENLESIVIFTSVENAKYFEEIINDCNNNERTQKRKIKSVFVLNGNHENYIPFEKLLEEGKDQILDRIPYFDVDPKNDIFLLLRSSGTTGLPKTAIISHYSFIASAIDFWYSKQFDNLRVLMAYPSGNIGVIIRQFVWFSSGATIVMLEK
jgi:fatty-acyl-CoA synthase